jgi:Phosphatidylinositol 3- and 4-kinase
LQQFVHSEGSVENISSDVFHRDEVHKIAILDLRILNLDRNEQNILFDICNK